MIGQLKGLYGRFQDLARNEGYIEASKAATRFVLKQTIGRPVKRIVRPLYQPPSIYFHSRFSNRWNVFNEEWDLLIILDGCRVDALYQVVDEYPFIEEIESKWSVGSHSSEWVVNTFNNEYRDEISKTSYISSNPQAWVVFEGEFEEEPSGGRFFSSSLNRLKRYKAKSLINPSDLHSLKLLYDRSEDYGSIKYPSPRSITDHVIALDRNHDSPPRIIAHYMPPHPPFIAQLIDGDIELTDKPRYGNSLEAYLDNLRWALEEVAFLLENVDRENVVITADHGWAFRFRLVRNSHLPGMFAPDVRRVPWVETSATDNRTYEPGLSVRDEDESISPEETLEALGYLS